MRVRKAIIPAAGLGTRMLPATKTVPKEMLPVAEKPLMQYAVEEAMRAGIEHILVITAREKSIIQDHFDRHLDLEDFLTRNGKIKEAEAIRNYLPHTGAIAWLRQDERLGLGHAIWCARHWVGDEAFAILAPDELLMSKENCTKKLIHTYEATGGFAIAMQDLPKEEVVRYGVVAGKDTMLDSGQNVLRVTQMVEKPSLAEAPSCHCIIGRYVLDARIFHPLDKKKRGQGGEIQLTDAMAQLLSDNEVYAVRYDGKRFDCGKRTGWLEANIAAALQNDELQSDMQKILQNYHNQQNGS